MENSRSVVVINSLRDFQEVRHLSTLSIEHYFWDGGWYLMLFCFIRGKILIQISYGWKTRLCFLKHHAGVVYF